MKLTIQTSKTRPLFVTGALSVFAVFVFCGLPPAFAQTSQETGQLLNRIKQLENQVQTMGRAIFRGDKGAENALAASSAAMDSADTTAAANFEVRMSQIEDQQRKMTGMLEKINFDLQQLKDSVGRMQADTEQRLQHVESGAASTAPAGQDILPNETVSPTPLAGGPTVGTLGTISSSGTASGSGPAEALYDSAFAGVRDAQYADAEIRFRQFLRQYPGHPLSANAQYWLGETYYVRGDYKEAAKTFAQGYQDFPKSGKAADSLFKLSLSLLKLDKKDDACLALRQLQKEFQSDSGPLQRKAQQEIKQLNCP